MVAMLFLSFSSFLFSFFFLYQLHLMSFFTFSCFEFRFCQWHILCGFFYVSLS
ncbi:hypothetical protein DsansV1_C28g0205991 [Dioscorea sansibarensis]